MDTAKDNIVCHSAQQILLNKAKSFAGLLLIFILPSIPILICFLSCSKSNKIYSTIFYLFYFFWADQVSIFYKIRKKCGINNEEFVYNTILIGGIIGPVIILFIAVI